MEYLNGFGFPTFCDQENEGLLHRSREIDKLAFATATTIIALIPVLISVQRLPTASIHELVLRNYDSLAIITAGLTFGLPVIQESSGTAVNAADYLRDGFPRNKHDCNGSLRTRCSQHVFSGVFALLQLLLVLMLALLNRTTFKSDVRTLWGCHGSAHIVWHVAFLLPIPIIGITWYCYLRWTHHIDGSAGTNEHLIIYRRRHWVQSIHPFADLLPGLAQMLMTVYFTFLFSTIYGVSVMAALVRVMTVATFLFVSRTASLWFARAASERHSKFLVRCESEGEVEKVRQQPERQQSSLPVLEARQLLGTWTTALRTTRSRAGTTTPQPTQNEPPSTAPQVRQSELPPFPTARESVSPEWVGGRTGLGEVVELIASLKETIEQQNSIIAGRNSIIESMRTGIAAIKEEQQYLKSQNAEPQETIGSLQAQLDIISISPPSTQT